MQNDFVTHADTAKSWTAVSKLAVSLNALAHRYGPPTPFEEELRNFKFYIDLTATSLVLNFHINRQ